jgi:TonB-linked SusC/RagA family outer membrane protein
MRDMSLCTLLLMPLLAVAVATPLQAQETGQVAGTVTDERGQPVATASVVVQGTRLNVLTGPNGKYVIPDVPAGTRTVVARLIGYGVATQVVTVTAGQSTAADFRLTAKAIELQGPVIVGYGEQERRTVTGAVSTVTAAQIAELPTSNAIKAIQGRIPGVDIVNAGNKPGDDVSILIRGVRSITANNNPLIVVDGVPIAGGIGDLNTADIVSINVLKDAAATAIYGSRGANGVVLVTTKGSGTGGVNTQFNVEAYVSGEHPYGLPTMMNPQQYLEMLQAAARYAGVPDDPSSVLTAQQQAAYAAGQATDWQKLIERTGVKRNVQFGMNGISENTRFNLSGNYFDQSGTAVGFDFNRFTGDASVDHVQGRLRLGITAYYTHSLQQTALGDALWGAARQQTGFGSPFDSTGLIVTHPDGDPLAWNPLKAVAGVRNDVTRDRLFASAFGTLQLRDGVNLRVNFGPDYTHQSTGHYEGSDAIFPGHTDREASYNQFANLQYTLDAMLQVNRDIGSMHHVDATLLYGIQKFRGSAANESAQLIPYDEALYYSLGQGQNYLLSTNLVETALESYMGRVVYTFQDRYTLSGALRRDGASQLAPGHKWVTFPTVGLAWQLGEEPFMEGFKVFSSLKLRGSWGVTGNSSIDAYQTQGALARTLYNFGTTTAGGYAPNASNPANPNLKWEKTAQTDGGVEFGLLRDRITGTVDLYRQNTSDLLLRRTLPQTSGYSQALQNIGKTRNSGIEIALSSINIDHPNGFRWQTDLSWAHNHNQIVALAVSDTAGCPPNARPCDLNNGWFVGQPINTGAQSAPLNSNGALTGDPVRRVWYDYKFLGIWQQSDSAEAATFGSKPGQIRVADINGDGVINARDMVLQGNTYPKWTASLYNRVTWKNFDLSALAAFRWGYRIYNTFIPGLSGRFGNIATDYWTPSTPSNNNPSPNLNAPVNYGSTRGYIDASHWRIRNIQVGYTLPKSLAGRVGASTARVYATATEPFVSYKYDYFDPESGWAGGSPVYRTLLVGANVTF